MPTAPILRGSAQPQLQNQSFEYDLTRGGSYFEEWKGANLSNMVTKYNGIIYTCRRAKMKVEKDVATATFEWSSDGSTNGPGNLGSNAVTQDRWECPEPKSEKDLFNHPTFLYICGSTGVTDAQLINVVSTIRRFAEQAKSAGQSLTRENDLLNTLSDYLTSLSLSMPGSTQLEAAMRYYRLYANDQTHYQSSQYALRHTTTAPNGWSLNVSDLNVNTIYSTTKMLGECENTSLWNFTLPGRLDYKLSAAASAFASVTPVRSNFQIGWLKSPSSESSVGNTRMEIQTGFVLDQWSVDVYPVYL